MFMLADEVYAREINDETRQRDKSFAGYGVNRENEESNDENRDRR